MLLDKTLEELDGQDWGEPTFQSSLVIDCHRLRRVSLKEFTSGNLRRLIGQHISLDYLVPVALAQLIDDPFVGDWYSGDVLDSLLSLPSNYWHGHPDLHQSLKTVIAKARSLIQSQDDLAFGVDSKMIDQLEKYG